jgi:hypothetical protein
MQADHAASGASGEAVEAARRIFYDPECADLFPNDQASLARALDSYAEARVRAAIETACAAVCEECRDGDEAHDGEHQSDSNPLRFWKCPAERIREAFAGAAKKEGA